MTTELEKTLVRELDLVAAHLQVPPAPSLPPASARQRLHARVGRPALVAAAVALLLGAGALLARGTLVDPGDPVVPATPSPTSISTSAPSVPFVVDERLHVDGTQVPGRWWGVESRGQQWLAQQADGSWWSGGPGRDTGRIAAELDQPPVLSPDGGYVAMIDLGQGAPVLTGFDTEPAGEGLGAAPVDLPRSEGGTTIRVRAVTDQGDVVVQGSRTALVWRAGTGDQTTVLDLSRTAPGQQVLEATAAGLVVVDGLDSDPQSVPAYLADLSPDGRLTRTGTLPLYDDLEVSPGGTRLVLSPPATLGGEVESVGSLEARAVAGGEEVRLAAPDGWGFAVGTWAWEDDRTLVAELHADDGRPAASPQLARCDAATGVCRGFPSPYGTAAQEAPDEPASAASVLDTVAQAAATGDRSALRDAAVIGAPQWKQLVTWTAGLGSSGVTCRPNGSRTRDCELDLEADPTSTYYAILEPADNAYGWSVTYVGIADG
ncbi:hypothetical protein BKA08_000081 [Nocardioides marinisabuli]|uniref:Uncharacterized protein n=1 Tax=Nocardioides marinisabuli TaxID=419476 RepID=A0A7Y9EXL8_9ACTN|nr:hypothetical protein [Nocardioides marinisabuli]NYD55843.1 hypothetical protein [Nocardioides marinisabuli]